MSYFSKIVFCVFTYAAIMSNAMAQQFIGPVQYSSFNDPLSGADVSPFSSIQFTYFHIEDFEDGVLNTPGVSIREFGTTNINTAFSDSVDGDDGVIDGVATGNSTSLFSDFRTSSFTFDFDQNALNGYPTHAGVVWTDIGRNNGGTPFSADLIDNTLFEAFDSAGSSIGIVGPTSLGDLVINRTTDEDRFFGVIYSTGISAIKITMPGKNNWEVDHLQYGRLAIEQFCNGLPVTVHLANSDAPTNGNDVIMGTESDDEINGLAGNDTICAGAGNDIIFAGQGNDWVLGGDGDDIIHGEGNSDSLFGEAGNDHIYGEENSDRLYGGDGDDYLSGGAKHDLIYGGRGEDEIHGGDGNDRLFGQQNHDLMYGDHGNDKLYGGQSNDDLFGGEGDDRMWGETGHDRLYGEEGDDSWLDGGDHNDIIYGGPGDDVIRGGDHRDRVYGQGGNDDVRAQSGDDLVTDGGGGIDGCQVAPGNDQPPINCEF